MKYKYICLGFLYESTDNFYVLRVFIHRILKEYKLIIDTRSKNRIKTSGVINNVDVKRANSSFAKDSRIDTVVFNTDGDARPERRKEIEGLVKSYYKNTNYVLAIPEENMERWLVSDIETLERITGLKVPIAETENSKVLLKSLIKKAGLDYQRTIIDIANNVDINFLSLVNKSFANFCDDLRSKYKPVDGASLMKIIKNYKSRNISQKLKRRGRLLPRELRFRKKKK